MLAMEYVVTELVPKLRIRFMTIDAFYDKDIEYDISGFYRKLGFNLVNENEKIPEDSFGTMYFDLKLLSTQCGRKRLSRRITTPVAKSQAEGRILSYWIS